MKTTIDVPDALARQAKTLAGETGTTLRDLVVEGLRTEIERRSAPPRVEFHFTTVGGSGLQVDAEPHRLTDLAYDLPR